LSGGSETQLPLVSKGVTKCVWPQLPPIFDRRRRRSRTGGLERLRHWRNAARGLAGAHKSQGAGVEGHEWRSFIRDGRQLGRPGAGCVPTGIDLALGLDSRQDAGRALADCMLARNPGRLPETGRTDKFAVQSTAWAKKTESRTQSHSAGIERGIPLEGICKSEPQGVDALANRGT